VLLPVRNAAAFLEECAASLELQSLADFEVMAVDDGSDDGSDEILASWARRDRRVRVLRQESRGLVAALNHGLTECRGELVARMDADDKAHRMRLELQVAAFEEQPEPDVVSCLVTHFPQDSVAEGFRIYEDWLNRLVTHDEILRERFIESPLPHPSVMLRRQVLVDVGGYRDLGWPEDYDLWLRLANRGARFTKVPEVLLYWRQHPDRLTRTDPRYAVERFLACKARHLIEGPLGSHDRILVWGAGQTGRRLSKHLLRGDARIVAFIDIDQRKIGRTLRGLPIYAANDLPRLLGEAARPVVLASVSSRGARRLIRRQLDELDLRETLDYWCVA
jgi:glycosyltransferase involved in cell wall biosynthesis